jgi:hypothetical protein
LGHSFIVRIRQGYTLDLPSGEVVDGFIRAY